MPKQNKENKEKKLLSYKDILPQLKEIKKEIAKILGTNDFELIVFGSYARGEAREDSDLDLLIVLQEEYIKDTWEKEREIHLYILNKHGLSSDVIIVTPKRKINYLLYSNIKEECVKV
jgi:predicted nucleotidyltransferase